MTPGAKGPGRPPIVNWTPRLIAVVAELSDRGLSNPSIVIVLELYEGIETNYQQVRRAKIRAGIQTRSKKTKIDSTNQEI